MSCAHICQNGPNKGNNCPRKISYASPSGTYCDKHYKKELREEFKDIPCQFVPYHGPNQGVMCCQASCSEEGYCAFHLNIMKEREKLGQCEALLTKGVKKGMRCTSCICDESKTGHYCRKHLAKEDHILNPRVFCDFIFSQGFRIGMPCHKKARPGTTKCTTHKDC